MARPLLREHTLSDRRPLAVNPPVQDRCVRPPRFPFPGTTGHAPPLNHMRMRTPTAGGTPCVAPRGRGSWAWMIHRRDRLRIARNPPSRMHPCQTSAPPHPMAASCWTSTAAPDATSRARRAGRWSLSRVPHPIPSCGPPCFPRHRRGPHASSVAGAHSVCSRWAHFFASADATGSEALRRLRDL